MISRTRTRGFTLIELLVVIAIIGILSSVVLASLNSARQKGRDARRISDIKQLQLALELYYDQNANYPTPPLGVGSGENLNGLIASIPTDPQTGDDYAYAALGSGSVCSSYHLGAVLETSGHSSLSSDSDAAAGTACTSGGTDFAGASAACTATAGTDACFDVKP